MTQARGAIAVANISHLVSIFSPALPSSGNLARCRLEKDSLCKFTLRALPTLKPAPFYRVLKHLQFTLLFHDQASKKNILTYFMPEAM